MVDLVDDSEDVLHDVERSVSMINDASHDLLLQAYQKFGGCNLSELFPRQNITALAGTSCRA